MRHMERSNLFFHIPSDVGSPEPGSSIHHDFGLSILRVFSEVSKINPAQVSGPGLRWFPWGTHRPTGYTDNNDTDLLLHLISLRANFAPS